MNEILKGILRIYPCLKCNRLNLILLINLKEILNLIKIEIVKNLMLIYFNYNKRMKLI